MSTQELDLGKLKKTTIEGNAKALIGIALLIHVPAWTIYFWQGWIYLILFGLCTVSITFYLFKHDPSLVAARQKAGPGAERETLQKWIQGAASGVGCMMFLVPGIERHFTGLPLPIWVVMLGDLLVVAGFRVVFLAFRENSHASSIIEVKSGQNVISTGPYAWVRHPMYTGCVLLFLATPVALGSVWALPPAMMLVLVLAIRLLDEERYLKANLTGYDAYCQKVKTRLVPYVW